MHTKAMQTPSCSHKPCYLCCGSSKQMLGHSSSGMFHTSQLMWLAVCIFFSPVSLSLQKFPGTYPKCSLFLLRDDLSSYKFKKTQSYSFFFVQIPDSIHVQTERSYFKEYLLAEWNNSLHCLKTSCWHFQFLITAFLKILWQRVKQNLVCSSVWSMSSN